MLDESNKVLAKIIERMIRPIVSFCVRRGVRHRDLVDVCKLAYIQAAKLSLYSQHLPISVSRIAVMTGLQRADINKLVKIKEPQPGAADFITRVIGAWARSRKFTDGAGRSRALSYRGQSSEFAKLVRSVSTDLNPHTVLFELERLELVTKTGDRVVLKSPAYITTGRPLETLSLGAADVGDLLNAVQDNSSLAHKVPHLHAKTEYDNVPEEALDEIREWFLDEGAKLHERARKFLSKFDRDINPEAKGKTGKFRVAIGTFSFIEDRSPRLSDKKVDENSKAEGEEV